MRRAASIAKAISFAALLGATGPAATARADSDGAVTPVTGFEVERYLGVWHEIALLPNWFQEDCVGGTTATYGLAEDTGGITVLNECLEEDGGRSAVEGRARFTGPADEGALEVTFVSLLGFWLWPLAGDYIVFGLDPDYRWAAIGHPSRDYGWILAREETLDRDSLAEIAEIFRAAGYDTCNLTMSARAIGDPTPRLCDRVAPD